MDDRKLLDTIRPLIGESETADDCSMFDLGDGRILVSSTDMLHETTDFPKGMTEFEMGWMSVAVTLSDIASTGAAPSQVLVAVGLDNPERLYPFMEGAVYCAEKFGTKVAGGDIDSHKELTAVTTAFGIVDQSVYCRRSGASVGDAVCVTGIPGRAQAALDGCEEFREFLLTPTPQVSSGQKIAHAGASSMMDVSDGVVISLYDIADASSVGIVLDGKSFPLFEESEYAKTCFLYGGGDFGLLFTASDAVLEILDIDYTVIGRVVEGNSVILDGVVLPRKGYAHVWGDA